VRVKGRPAQSETPSRKEAQQWAQSIETAIPEGRHFPHAAARRTSFDALVKDYTETVLAEFDEKKVTRTRRLKWWAEQFAGLARAEITADAISQVRNRLAQRSQRVSTERPTHACPNVIRTKSAGWLSEGHPAPRRIEKAACLAGFSRTG